jgi:hypothetical protein
LVGRKIGGVAGVPNDVGTVFVVCTEAIKEGRGGEERKGRRNESVCIAIKVASFLASFSGDLPSFQGFQHFYLGGHRQRGQGIKIKIFGTASVVNIILLLPAVSVVVGIGLGPGTLLFFSL